MSMKRANPPFKQGIQNCSKMILTSLRQVRNWWCVPFDFINRLKDKKWTCIDKKWLARLMKHLKKAQPSTIKQIRFIKHIRRLDIYDNSREYEIEDDCYYEVFLENNLTHYVSFGQINDIIGDEEWLQAEGNRLCNIASSWIVSLTLWAKKKESTHSDALCVCEGDCVSVENHLDILSALTRTPEQLLWSGKRHWKRTLLT